MDRGGSTTRPVSMPWKTFELAKQRSKKRKKEIVLNVGISKCAYLNEKSSSPHFDS
jgi:hypothetical protein